MTTTICIALKFLSTLSLRRATDTSSLLQCQVKISIHALLAESDQYRGKDHPLCHNFYPRSPCGERRHCKRRARAVADFYPRSPCGERLGLTSRVSNSCFISIHALLAESDTWTARQWISRADFYPRSPCGERRRRCICLLHRHHNFYPRSPCGERPAFGSLGVLTVSDFYPRSPCGERPFLQCKC